MYCLFMLALTGSSSEGPIGSGSTTVWKDNYCNHRCACAPVKSFFVLTTRCGEKSRFRSIDC